MLARLVNCSSDHPGSCPNASDKTLCWLALVPSQLKPSLFLTLEIGTLAHFVEILALSSEILAPISPIPAESGMHTSETLYVRLEFLDVCVVSDSLHYEDHYATMSYIC